MTKADLERRIDRRAGDALGAAGTRVTPSTATPSATVVDVELFVGKQEGPHAGLFRMSDDTVLLRVADTANVPILSAGAVDYRPNSTFLNIGYANRPGIRLPMGDQTPGAAEQIRGIEVDAEALVGMLPPDIIPLDAINSSMIDWGMVGLQVSAADVPIADAGGFFVSTKVEGALQEIGGGMAYIMANWPA